jgi:hypothetical protein
MQIFAVRPLTDQLLLYCAQDVAHLFGLYTCLSSNLSSTELDKVVGLHPRLVQGVPGRGCFELGGTSLAGTAPCRTSQDACWNKSGYNSSSSHTPCSLATMVVIIDTANDSHMIFPLLPPKNIDRR